MRHLLLNKNFVRLWLGQLISGVATILFDVGVMVTIFEETGSALQTAVVTVAATLPHFLLGPLAGAIVDRYPRRTVLMVMDMGRALLVASLLLILQTTAPNVWVLYFIVIGLAAAMALHEPARSAIIPELVTRQQIVTANSLILSTRPLYYAIGYLLGGALVLVISFRTFIMVSVGLFVAAAVLEMFISGERREERGERNTLSTLPSPLHIPLRQSIREGIAYLRQHQLARALVWMEGIEYIGHGIWMPALMLIFVQRALRGNADDWGWQNGVFWVGQIVGVVTVLGATRLLARRPGWIIIGNAFLAGLLTLIYAASPTLWFAHFIAFVFGPPFAWRDVAQDSLLQTTVESAVLGRVYALRSMFLNLMLMLSTLLFAWLADQLPIRWIYVAGGVVYIATALLALSSRAMRQSNIAEEQRSGGAEAITSAPLPLLPSAPLED
jgi:MFS family permease